MRTTVVRGAHGQPSTSDRLPATPRLCFAHDTPVSSDGNRNLPDVLVFSLSCFQKRSSIHTQCTHPSVPRVCASKPQEERLPFIIVYTYDICHSAPRSSAPRRAVTSFYTTALVHPSLDIGTSKNTKNERKWHSRQAPIFRSIFMEVLYWVSREPSPLHTLALA
jgi:hypothetical protein